MKCRYIECPPYLPLFWSGACCVTVYPFVFVIRRKDFPDIFFGWERVFAHAAAHLAQQKTDWFFFPRYIFSRKWRRIYECDAYTEDVRILLTKGIHQISIVHAIADCLSSSIYGTMISYRDAQSRVCDMILSLQEESNERV